MFELLKDFFIKSLGMAFPLLVRWFYKTDKLNKGIKIRIRSEGDGVVYYCGQLPKVNIWIVVTNFTPFEIEVDRIYGQLAYGCVLGELSHLKRHKIKSAEEIEVLLELSLNENQQKHIRENYGKVETRLFLGAHIICKIHSLELSREIQTNNVRHLNCQS